MALENPSSTTNEIGKAFRLHSARLHPCLARHPCRAGSLRPIRVDSVRLEKIRSEVEAYSKEWGAEGVVEFSKPASGHPLSRWWVLRLGPYDSVWKNRCNPIFRKLGKSFPDAICTKILGPWDQKWLADEMNGLQFCVGNRANARDGFDVKCCWELKSGRNRAISSDLHGIVKNLQGAVPDKNGNPPLKWGPHANLSDPTAVPPKRSVGVRAVRVLVERPPSGFL